MASAKAVASVVEQLGAFFRRNGYVRRQRADRLEAMGCRHYKKGDEVRFVALAAAEVRTIQLLLQIAGFKPGRSFAKNRQWRVPVYGREEVARLMKVVGRRRKRRAAGGAWKKSRS